MSFPELDVLRRIADSIIQSDPLRPETWDLDLSPCQTIAKRHLAAWSSDIQNRAVYGTAFSRKGTFIMDSKLEIGAVRALRNETQKINKSTNSFSNACAELFLSRTSAPFYHGEPSSYPVVYENEKNVTSRMKDIWTYLRESSGSLTRSTKDDYRFMKYYFSVPVRVELFEQTGLAGPSMASTMIKKVYPHGVTIPVFQRGNPQIQTGLGVELHAMGDPNDKLQLAAIACRGAFHATFTWDRFSSALVQGGWPWLRGYSRAYAKVVYTVMVLIFAAVENYNLGDMAAMRMRILALAGKLVGNPNGGVSPWRVRASVYLTGPKLAARARLQPLASNGHELAHGATELANGTVTAAKKAGPVLDEAPWVYLSEQPPPLAKQVPSHIINGNGCAHNDEDIFSGRVKIAHSIEEVERLTGDRDGITVAMTDSDERARHELWDWATKSSTMTVQRGQGQCLGCAVKVAHCVGALVVVV